MELTSLKKDENLEEFPPTPVLGLLSLLPPVYPVNWVILGPKSYIIWALLFHYQEVTVNFY